MNDDKYKKLCAFALIAILLALIGYSAAISAQTTADTNANITNVFEIVVNNTNLAPSFVGEPPGTNERVSGTNYTNSLYPLQIMLYAHAQTVSQTSDIRLYINGSMVSSVSSKPVGGGEENNKSIIAIIPKNSIYSVVFSNYHHYEWREYPILSGRNGTLSIIGNDTLKVNKSGDTLTGNLTFDNNSLLGIFLIGSYNFNPDLLTGSGIVFYKDSMFVGYNNVGTLGFTSAGIEIINSDLNLNGNNITGCGNCIDNDTLKVNKSGDSMTGILNMQNNTIKMMSDSANNTAYSTINETYPFSTTGSDPSGNMRFTNFTPVISTTITALGVNVSSTSSGHYRMAIYTNGTGCGFGCPDVLLNESASLVPVPGWNNASIPNTTVTAGTKYWIALQTQSTTVVRRTDGLPSGETKYRTYAYAAFPSPAGASDDAYGFNMRSITSINSYVAPVQYCIRIYNNGSLYTVSC